MSEMFDLTGKVAIVTGGNGGIGRAIAVGMAQHGADIVVAARNEQKTAAVVKEIEALGRRCLGVRCDVLEQDDIINTVEMAVRELGSLNILVNNSGIGQGGEPTQTVTLETWHQVIDTNLTSAFLFSKAAHPMMVKAGGGKIINIGSMTSIFGSDWVAPYSASKGGVVQLTKSLAIAWAVDNIQVNAILPGWIHTDLTASIKNNFADRYETIRSRIPQGRWGEPEEMGGCAVFLASKASDYVTGVSIPVDGGYTAF